MSCWSAIHICLISLFLNLGSEFAYFSMYVCWDNWLCVCDSGVILTEEIRQLLMDIKVCVLSSTLVTLSHKQTVSPCLCPVRMPTTNLQNTEWVSVTPSCGGGLLISACLIMLIIGVELEGLDSHSDIQFCGIQTCLWEVTQFSMQ